MLKRSEDIVALRATLLVVALFAGSIGVLIPVDHAQPTALQSTVPQKPPATPAPNELPLTTDIQALADMGCDGKLSFFGTTADEEITHSHEFLILERKFGSNSVILWHDERVVAQVNVNREGSPPELKRYFGATREDLKKVYGPSNLSDPNGTLHYSIEGYSLIFAFVEGRVSKIVWQCAD